MVVSCQKRHDRMGTCNANRRARPDEIWSCRSWVVMKENAFDHGYHGYHGSEKINPRKPGGSDGRPLNSIVQFAIDRIVFAYPWYR